MEADIRAQLTSVVDSVVHRAHRQGFVLARDIRAELGRTDLPEAKWKDVVALAGTSLHYHKGRYYHSSAFSPRLVEEQEQQEEIRRAIRRVIRLHRAAAAQHDRRQADRITYLQPVVVEDQEGKRMNLLCRDLSTSGLRLLGLHRLLGQKVRVYLSVGPEDSPYCLLVRILWTCAVVDGLFENGGSFVELVK